MERMEQIALIKEKIRKYRKLTNISLAALVILTSTLVLAYEYAPENVFTFVQCVSVGAEFPLALCTCEFNKEAEEQEELLKTYEEKNNDYSLKLK